MAVRVAIADDHPAVLAGMEHLLSGFSDISVIGLATDSTQLVDLLGSQSCDVVITDFSMPKGRYGDGLALLRFLQRRFPQVRLVILTGVESSAILRSILGIGVGAVVSKADDLSLLELAIRSAYDKKDFLSPIVQRIVDETTNQEGHAETGGQLSKRETEVLRLYAEGFSVTDIGSRIGRSRKTVSAQKNAAMKKLGLQRDADIFKYALAYGLIQASQQSRESAMDSSENT